MILPDARDAVHKAWLYRILSGFADNRIISDSLCFKGGTCAAMRGFLDRFSIDLDFDFTAPYELLKELRIQMESVFDKLGLSIADKSGSVPQYFLKYPVKDKNARNTLKIDVTMPHPSANKYEMVRLNEIDRIFKCQTLETMFANKLVAFIERYEKNKTIAARDLYDIHHFFIAGYRYNKEVIMERRKLEDLKSFFAELVVFTGEKITDKIITQDLNILLPYEKFSSIRKVIKGEVIVFLNDEAARCG